MEKSGQTTVIPKGKALVVSHDAGGAEILSSLLKLNDMPYLLCLAGPAVNIFQRKLCNQKNYSLDKGINQADWILTGTSWASDLEYRAIGLAKSKGKNVVSFLDHWVNYKERFIRNNILHLPDEIWVGDEYASVIAQKDFPSKIIKFVTNFYFEDIISNIEKIEIEKKKDDTIRILYVSDVIQDFSINYYGHPNYFGYNEYEAMDNFLITVTKKKLKKYKIRIRLHPSEVNGKYRQIINSHPELPLKESKASSLFKDCVWADWIVGQQSMALIVGLMAGKKVFSCIPPGGKKSQLPFNNIKEFSLDKNK